MKQLSVALALTLALGACTKAPEPTAAPAASDQPAEMVAPAAATATATAVAANPLDASLAGAWRSDANKARDVYRHPKETLTFFGVAPGQTVIEITPGGGWYMEILAPLLKDNGNYVAAFPNDGSSDYAKRSNEKLRAKLAADPEHFGAVKIAEYDPKTPSLNSDSSADVVLTFRNVHNWGENAPAMFRAFNAALKPGGILGVVEHRAAAGADPASLADSGYVPTEAVIKLATDAGFTLVEQSEINANPKDTKDYPEGVWTLPPGLALKDVDKEKYLAIGESDRMTLKFAKPKADQIFEQDTDTGAAKPEKK